MAKVLRTAAIVVGAVALVATGVGAIGAIAAGTSVAAGIASTTVLGLSVTALSAISTGLGLAATLAAKKPSTSLAGDQTKFTINKDQGLPWAFGRTSVAGWIVHRQTFDALGSEKNTYQSIFAVWSLGPIQEIEAFQVDKVTVTFSGTAAQGNYAEYMWLNTQLGAAPEASALPAVSFNPTVGGWGASSKLSGYAAYSWTLKWDKKGKKFPNGVPQPSAILKAAKVWDPRKDSTYPGGSGSHRPNDPSTWEWTENGPLLALQWARGLFQNGKRLMGIGFALASINVASFVEAANVADANDWTCGGVAYSTDGKWDVLKKFLATASGEPIQTGGLLNCIVDTPRVSLATIHTADIIGDASVTATPASRDRINGVIPRYRSEDHDWQLVPAAPVVVDAYVTADGRARTRELTWEYVQDVDQVAELATYAIVNAREFGPIVTPLKLKWIGYKPGDCLTIASPELGMDSQTVLVMRRSLDPATGAVTLTSRSETTAKHAYALGQTGTPPPTPSLQVLGEDDLAVPGYTAGWSGVEDDDGGRPEDNATDGAILDPDAEHGALLGADGLPIFPSELLNTAISLSPDGRLIAAIEQIGGGISNVALGRIDLPELGAATAAQRQQLDDAIAKLSEAVARLATGQARVQNVFRDAGLFTDPASGKAKLFAIEQRAEQISNLSVSLDAAVAQIGLKASVDYVNNAIASAVLDPSQIADFDAILVRLTSAEVDIDGLQASVLLKADATTVTTLTGTVTSVQTALSALTGTVATKADSTTVTAIDARLATAESTLTALGDTASITQAVTASRRVPINADQAAMSVLQALTQGDLAARTSQQAIALARQELTAKIIDDVSAEASARTALEVKIGTVQASVETEQVSRISGDAALAASLATYQAATDLNIATINTSVSAVTSAQSATASSLSSFQTSTSSTLASLTSTQIAQSTSISAISGSVTTLSTTVGGQTATLTSHASSINGLSVKIGVETDVNGYVTGWVFNNSGLGRSDFAVRVDRFLIASPGNPALVPFEVNSGITYIKSAVIRDLSVGTIKIAGEAITKRRFSQMVGTRSGTGSGNWQTACSITVSIPYESEVILQASGQHAYFSGTQPWQMRFVVDGGQVQLRGGDGGITDLPTFNGAVADLAAGSHTFELQWWATNSNLQLTSANLIVDPAMK